MTREQVAEVLRTLGQAGWKCESWLELLDSGADVDPLARCEHRAAAFDLIVACHTSEPYLSLELTERNGDVAVTARLFPRAGVAPILSAISNRQESLDGETFVDLMKELVPLCDPLLLETEKGLLKMS